MLLKGYLQFLQILKKYHLLPPRAGRPGPKGPPAPSPGTGDAAGRRVGSCPPGAGAIFPTLGWRKGGFKTADGRGRDRPMAARPNQSGTQRGGKRGKGEPGVCHPDKKTGNGGTRGKTGAFLERTGARGGRGGEARGGSRGGWGGVAKRGRASDGRGTGTAATGRRSRGFYGK